MYVYRDTETEGSTEGRVRSKDVFFCQVGRIRAIQTNAESFAWTSLWRRGWQLKFGEPCRTTPITRIAHQDPTTELRDDRGDEANRACDQCSGQGVNHC